ncbi:MAG: glycosyltransferase family 1 protein [Betaproteobacteria bacterium]|nr:glycosyltransferase family 1 protein [Betaproteobacteria bacterium]
MNILIVTDAWLPQVNGVVRTLEFVIAELRQLGHNVEVLHPNTFRRLPCPGYPEIELALWPARGVARRIEAFAPHAIHIATEGPLGWAARRWCLRNGRAFTTAYHTKFPEIVHGYTRLPVRWGYAVMRRFHGPSHAMLVPTPAVARELRARGFDNAVEWSHGVDTQLFKPDDVDVLGTARPRWLFVGRASVEKNIEAFCRLPLPGSKWVVGVGPILARLKAEYRDVNFRGVLAPEELARTYASSDVFVFPSKADTFGLVMLEALACGTPVAAYPVPGPLDVIGDSPAGALDADLRAACLRALQIPRDVARAYAQRFDWRSSAELMLRHLAVQPLH